MLKIALLLNIDEKEQNLPDQAQINGNASLSCVTRLWDILDPDRNQRVTFKPVYQRPSSLDIRQRKTEDNWEKMEGINIQIQSLTFSDTGNIARKKWQKVSYRPTGTDHSGFVGQPYPFLLNSPGIEQEEEKRP